MQAWLGSERNGKARWGGVFRGPAGSYRRDRERWGVDWSSSAGLAALGWKWQGVVGQARMDRCGYSG